MLDPSLLQKIMGKALANGGEYADVYVELRETTALVVEDGKLEKVITGSEAGVGIRLICEGKTSYAFSNDFAPEALLAAAAEVNAASGRGAGKEDRDRLINLSVRRPSVAFPIELPPSEIPLERKIGLVRNSDRTARAFDNRIRQVTVI